MADGENPAVRIDVQRDQAVNKGTTIGEESTDSN